MLVGSNPTRVISKATMILAINPEKDEWLKRNLSPSEAEIDLSLLLPAGTETSITAIRATMLFLMTSPSIYQKLKQEIADGIKQGSISSPIKHEEAKQLPYLQVSSLVNYAGFEKSDILPGHVDARLTDVVDQGRHK